LFVVELIRLGWQKQGTIFGEKMLDQVAKLKKIFNDYPRAFWTYNLIVFIDHLGGFMLYPFFS